MNILESIWNVSVTGFAIIGVLQCLLWILKAVGFGDGIGLTWWRAIDAKAKTTDNAFVRTMLRGVRWALGLIVSRTQRVVLE